MTFTEIYAEIVQQKVAFLSGIVKLRYELLCEGKIVHNI